MAARPCFDLGAARGAGQWVDGLMVTVSREPQSDERMGPWKEAAAWLFGRPV